VAHTAYADRGTGPLADELSEAIAADWHLYHHMTGARMDVIVPVWCRLGAVGSELERAERPLEVGSELERAEEGPTELWSDWERAERPTEVEWHATAGRFELSAATRLARLHVAQLAWCCGAIGVGP
jgi:hypothetical protein